MKRSEQVGDLVAALAKAQAEFGIATKEATNAAFGRPYKYADLAANIGAIRPSLSKHGIALMQFNDSDLERQTGSVTTSLHFGEQFISTTAEAPATGRSGFDVQSLGACWTYLRRYTLQALCGLASEDDDAGNLTGVDNKPIPKVTTNPVDEPAVGEFKFVTPDTLVCVVRSIKEWPKTDKLNASLNVLMNGYHEGCNFAACWHESLFAAVRGAVGKQCEFKIGVTVKKGVKYVNIEDVLFVDGMPYKDGKPVENLDAEPVA